MLEQQSKFEKHFEITANNTVALELLAATTGLSKQHLKQVMQKGSVWVGRDQKAHRLRRAKKLLQKGEMLHIYYDPEVLKIIPPEPMLIADEGYYSIWNKPYGMLAQGSKWGDHCTIMRWAEQHLKPERVSFAVHRLDRAANGLIIVAHAKSAAAALSKLFQERKIKKNYKILVHGKFSEQATKQNPIKMDSDIDGRAAVSYFSRLDYDPNQGRSLLDVSIDTGRKHQIRLHSSLLGFPVVGDRLYGIEGDKEDLQLSAYYLSFECPYAHTMKIFSIAK